MATQDYTGTDILEVLAGIHNYNNHLADLVNSRVAGGSRLIDFGAGIGTFSKILRDLGHRVECVELDEKQAGQLRASGFPTTTSLASYADDSLPVIFTFNVLEHIEHDVDVMRELWKKLKPGGQLIVYVPANRFLWTSLDDKVLHFRRYGKKELREKLVSVGFANPTVHYADSLGVPATLAYRLLDPGDGRIDAGKARFYDRVLFPVSRVLDCVFKHVTGKNLVAIAVK